MKIEERIKNARLTKKAKIITQFLLDHPSEAAFMSATSIAKKLNVSDVMVIRLARTLGYDGYYSMQKDLQQKMIAEMETARKRKPSLSEKIIHIGKEQDQSISDMTLSKTWENLQETVWKNPDSKYVDAAKILRSSRKKYIVGFRASAAMALYLSIKMRFVSDDVITLMNADPNEVDQLYSMQEEDCLVVFSMGRYPRMSLFAIEIAKKRRAKIIVITEKETSPAAFGVDIVFIAKSDGLSFSAYAGPLITCEILVTHLAKETWPLRELRIAEIDEEYSQMNFFLT